VKPKRRRYFHQTTRAAADAIMSQGFCDGVGTYGTDREWRGVWISDMPLDSNEGACGETLLQISLNATTAELDWWEWVEEGKGYREWLIPAEFLNSRISYIGVVSYDPIRRPGATVR
jgi:hypothetical protein